MASLKLMALIFHRNLTVSSSIKLEAAARGGAEPLAQTRLGKMSRWKATSIEYANNFVATFRRTRAGLNLESYMHLVASLKTVETLQK